MEVFGSSKSGVVFGTAFVGAGRDEKRAPLKTPAWEASSHAH